VTLGGYPPWVTLDLENFFLLILFFHTSFNHSSLSYLYTS
jgi:hypothetical protein